MVGATAMVAMAAPPLLAPLAVLVEVVVARRRHHACAHVCQVLMCVLCHAMLHARALRALAPSDAHASRVGERLRVSLCQWVNYRARAHWVRARSHAHLQSNP